jgi:hypothetical protein
VRAFSTDLIIKKGKNVQYAPRKAEKFPPAGKAGGNFWLCLLKKHTNYWFV